MRTDDLLQRALALDFLSAEEGVFLFENASTAELMYVAHRLRMHQRKPAPEYWPLANLRSLTRPECGGPTIAAD